MKPEDGSRGYPPETRPTSGIPGEEEEQPADTRPYRSPLVERIGRAVDRTFANLDRYPYLADHERGEFCTYRKVFDESLAKIDAKIASGLLTPLQVTTFPEPEPEIPVPFSTTAVRAGLFIGSFDPFQMTHLTTALRFLSSSAAKADVLFVVPEGGANPLKPVLSEYEYRLELIRNQLERIFSPLIIPLDIGRGENTIGVVTNFIRLFPGREVQITHVLGSDVLLWVHELFAKDLEIWNAAAAAAGVTFAYRLFVIRRGREISSRRIADRLRKQGIPVFLDMKIIGAPSSTDFRERHALTIIFPTEEILRHMEFAFRYHMNRGWPGWSEQT